MDRVTGQIGGDANGRELPVPYSNRSSGNGVGGATVQVPDDLGTSAAGGAYHAWSVNVLTLRGDRIAAITSFIGAEHHAAFGLATWLS